MGTAIGVTDTVIRFKLGNRDLQLDFRKIPFMKWSQLKQIGFTQRTLVSALQDLDVEAVASLIWLERCQRERKLEYSDVISEINNFEGEAPEFEIIDLVIRGKSLMGRAAVDDNGQVVIEPAEQPDPTSGS